MTRARMWFPPLELEYRAAMLLEPFKGMSFCVQATRLGGPVPQHLDEVEQEAELKGGVMHTVTDHFAMVYKIHPCMAA